MTSPATAEPTVHGRRPTVLYQFMLAPPAVPPDSVLEGMVFEDLMDYATLGALAAGGWTVTQGSIITISAGNNNPHFGANTVQWLLDAIGSGGTQASIEHAVTGLTPGATAYGTFEWWADGHWFEPMVMQIQSGTVIKSKGGNPAAGAGANFGEAVTSPLTVQAGGSVTLRVYLRGGYPLISHNDLWAIGRIRLFVSDTPVPAPVEDVEYFRTSYRKPVLYRDNTYVPCEIEHSEPTWGVEDSPGTIQITLPADDEIAEFFREGITPAIPMVAIYEFHRPPDTDPNPENVRSALYEIISADHSPRETTLTCSSLLGQLDVVVPSGLAQRDYCAFQTYDALTCGVDPSGFTHEGEVTAIGGVLGGLAVTVSGAAAFGGADPDFFTLGEIKQGIYHSMIREQNEDTVILEEMIPGLTVGSTVTLLAGDDRTKETCRDKFANSDRRLSFPRMPISNPFYGQGLRP